MSIIEVSPFQLEWEQIKAEKALDMKYRYQQAWVTKVLAHMEKLEEENKTLKAALQKVLSAKGRWVRITEADLVGKTP